MDQSARLRLAVRGITGALIVKRRTGRWMVAVLILGVLALLLTSCGPETPRAEPGLSVPVTGSAALQSPINTPTPTPQPIQPGPTPTKVPLCAPSVVDEQPSEHDAALDTPVFGDPQVILTDTAPIDIAAWMPDGRNLLVVRHIPGQSAQAIETFDIDTGRTVRYAEAVTWTDQVFPLAQGRGVGFLDRSETVQGQTSASVNLKVSRGPGQVQPTVYDVSFRTMAVDPHSASLVRYALAPGGPPALSPQAHQDFRVLTLPVDPYQWKYPTYFPDRVETGYSGDVFQAAVRPDGSMVAFYADPYLFLYDTRTERACEVDLGVAENGQPRFTWDARWSPDGRYLAMLTSARFPGELLPFADLTILDRITGELKHLNPSSRRMVTDFIWAPDTRHLIILGKESSDQGLSLQRLFLIDALTNQANVVLDDFVFGTRGNNAQLAWFSGNKYFAAVPCLGDAGRVETFLMESSAAWRVCLIRVDRSQ